MQRQRGELVPVAEVIADLPRHSVSHGGGIPYDIIRTSLRPLVR